MLIDIIVFVLFAWLFVKAAGLALRMAWGITKIIFVILLVLCLPSLAAVLLMASGVILFAPVCAVGVILLILKALT